MYQQFKTFDTGKKIQIIFSVKLRKYPQSDKLRTGSGNK